MAIDDVRTKLSQDELIRILDFVCKSSNHRVSKISIKNGLFPDIEIGEFNNLFTRSLFAGIKPISVFLTGNVIDHIVYRDGLDEYVKNLKKMVKKEKLHRIVEFLSNGNKGSYDSGEIAKAFSPELDFHEVNTLCRILINNEDVRDCTTKDESIKGMVAVLVINETHDAFHTKKYLEEDEEFTTPIQQNISATNVIVGNVSGTASQEDNSTKILNEKGKLPWLKILYWIIGVLVGLSILYTFIKGII